MNKWITLLFLITSFFTKAQEHNSLEFMISNGTYKSNNSYLEFELKIVNKSKKSVTILKPFSHFFDKHYSFTVDSYANLKNQKPYTLIVSQNKKCRNNEIARIIQNQGESRKITFKDIIEIPSNKSVNLGKIKIDIEEENFCKKREYKIAINYAPEIVDVYEKSIAMLDKERNNIIQIEKNVNKIFNENNVSSASFYPTIQKIDNQIIFFNVINTLGKIKIKSKQYSIQEIK